MSLTVTEVRSGNAVEREALEWSGAVANDNYDTIHYDTLRYDGIVSE